VGKFNDGIFVLMLIESTGAAVHEVERRLRVTEPVIKFLTVRTDEELKRLDKVKKLRDRRRKSARTGCGSCRSGNASRSGRSGSAGSRAGSSGFDASLVGGGSEDCGLGSAAAFDSAGRARHHTSHATTS